jgi:predicted metal-binding membrane protein
VAEGKIVCTLAGISLVAWIALLAVAGGAVSGITLCTPGDAWAAVSTLSLVALAPPASLDTGSAAGWAANWALMMAAMMPLLIAAPLLHVREQSFARRRLRALLLFGAGYGPVWLAAGLVLQPLALAFSLLPPGAGLAALAAIVWQVSPAKQVCLNGCHRQPALAAFGIAADVDALGFGVSHALWCIGACWPLMLLALTVGVSGGAGHLAAMLAAALFALAERFEPPGPFVWRARLPLRLVRIALALAAGAASGCGFLGWSSLRQSSRRST